MSCVNCHQFHGPPENENLCSSCYRLLHPGKAQELLQAQQLKRNYDQRWKDLCNAENILQLMECYRDSPPYPDDIMEAKLRDIFKTYARDGKGRLCQELMNSSNETREIILRMCPDILSNCIGGMRHRYGTPPRANQTELFDYLLTVPEFKSALTEKDLQTALCIHQGTDMIQRLIDVSKEGIFDLTKSSLETAQYLIKRPHNVPTPEKKAHILLIKNALLEQKARKKQQQGVKRKKTSSSGGEGESKGDGEGEGDEDSDEEETENAASRERDFIKDMIKYGVDEGDIPFNNDAVGMKIYLATDEDNDRDSGDRRWQRREYFIVTEFVKKRGGNSRLIARKEQSSSSKRSSRKAKTNTRTSRKTTKRGAAARDEEDEDQEQNEDQEQEEQEEDDVVELDEDTVMCDWVGGVSPKQLTLWESYQERVITEGVWSSHLSDTDTGIALQSEFNSLVDEFGANEPVDYHPETKNIVRDLIHPSLFPLILPPPAAAAAAAGKGKGKGKTMRYDESQRNFFHRPYEISRFQWLPSEVDVDQDGVAKFVSPINNLDETRYPQLYDCLGRILTKLVPGFEQVWSYAQTLSFTDQFFDSAPSTPPPVSFSNQRLQVIVKLTEYEFKPHDFFDGVWHYEGMSHENIVMTGLYYPFTDPSLQSQGLEFKRAFTDKEAQEIAGSVPQDRPKWLEKQIENGFVPLGHMTTETSKMIVFPNSHAHRVMRIQPNSESDTSTSAVTDATLATAADVGTETKTIKRRLLAFFVIDPLRRIESSADHPPLPRQISMKEALKNRLDLMKERKYYKESLNPRAIELCEH